MFMYYILFTDVQLREFVSYCCDVSRPYLRAYR